MVSLCCATDIGDPPEDDNTCCRNIRVCRGFIIMVKNKLNGALVGTCLSMMKNAQF
jgi:hypothetical protein